MKSIGICIIILILVIPAFAKTHNILDYGAIGDGETNSTKAIQEAFNACGNTGGTVIFPEGTYLCGTVELRSNMTVKLDKGTIWKGLPQMKNYKYLNPYIPMRFSNDSRRVFIYGQDIKNTTVTGDGIIDGNGGSDKMQDGIDFSTERPYGIFMVRSKNITIENISIRNSAFWQQHYVECDSLILSGLKVWNHCNQNNNGIVINDCKNVIIKDCIVDTSGDAICLKSEGYNGCENVNVQNCEIASFASAIKLGTGSVTSFKNISFSNCNVLPSKSETNFYNCKFDKCITAIAISSVDGAAIENVAFNDITIDGCHTPLYIRLGARLGRPIETKAQSIGYIRGISFNNIQAKNCGDISSFICGMPDNYIEDIKITNCSFDISDYTSDRINKPMVPELPKAHPSNNMFKTTLPAYGLYIRHAKNVEINGIKLACLQNENRSAIILNDVIGFVLQDIVADQSKLTPLINTTNSNNLQLIGTNGFNDIGRFIKVNGDKTNTIVFDDPVFRDTKITSYVTSPESEVIIDTAVTVNLRWGTNKPNPGLWSFKVERDDELVGTTRETNFIDFKGINESEKYVYTITPTDVWGNSHNPLKVTVKIPKDKTLPEIRKILVLDNHTIRLHFSEAINVDALLVNENISIKPSLQVLGSSIYSRLILDLELSTITKGVNYKLKINELKDISQNQNLTLNSSILFSDNPLVAHVKFEEENPAYTYNNVKFEEGWVGNCAYFNGSTTNIVTNDKHSNNVDGILAISFWFKTDDPTAINDFCVLDKKEYWDASEGYRVEINPGLDQFIIMGGSIELSKRGKLKKTFDNSWHHYVSIIKDGIAMLYVDGILVNQKKGVTQAVASNTPLVIGSSFENDCFMKGWIDELYIFNRALSMIEIEDLYSRVE